MYSFPFAVAFQYSSSGVGTGAPFCISHRPGDWAATVAIAMLMMTTQAPAACVPTRTSYCAPSLDAAPSFFPVAVITTDLALARLDLFRPRLPSTVTSSPFLSNVLVQPSRVRPLGLPISISQFVTAPVCLSCTSMNRNACFFFNDTATTEIYTLSLHDALPISPMPDPW